MKTKLLALTLLAGGSMFAQSRFSIGISVGGANRGGYYTQAPPAYASAVPPCPGPGYSWVDGYWSQNSRRNSWVQGYWTRQSYNGAYERQPRYDNNDRFDRDRDDDRDRGRENRQEYRQGNIYGNGFRRR